MKNLIISALTAQMSLSPYAYAQKAPAEMEKKFNQIVSSFKKNPSYSSASAASQALWELNNKYPFVADNNDAAFTRKFEAFQLQMEEIKTATESLGSCAGGDPALQRKVISIGDAFAASVAKKKPDETPVKAFKEMNTTSFANTCTSIKPGQVVSTKQLQSYKALQKAFNDHNEKYAGKTKAQIEAMNWRERNNAKTLFDYKGKTLAEKTAAMEKEKKWKAAQLEKMKKEAAIQKNSLVNVKGFAGSEVRNHIRNKFGFVMNDKEKKESAEKLHLTLMAGNRENALRNYLYYSQRFDFSGEEDLTQYSDSRLRQMVSRQGDDMFQGLDWQGQQQLSSSEMTRLGAAGAKEIEAYKKNGKSQKLSLDDVYARLLPYLKEGGYVPPEDLNQPVKMQSSKNFSKAIKQIELKPAPTTKEGYQAQQSAKFVFQQKRYNAMVKNAEKGEVGFLLQSKDFDKYKTRGLSGLTKSQVMGMIKASLKEKIQDTKDYSKDFVRKYQTTKNLWGDRGVDGLAEIGKTLLYSSPTVIYDTIANNPKLMGSMCLPLKHAAKEKDLSLPSYVKFGGGMMSAVPVGGQVAGFAAGTTFGVAMVAEYRYRMATKLSADADAAGLGNHHTRGQEEARADKSELNRAAQAQKNQMGQDVLDITKDNALAAAGGYAIGKGVSAASSVSKVRSVAVSSTAEAEAVSAVKVTSKINTSQKISWLKDLDDGIGGKTGTMTDQANQRWSEFKTLAQQKAGKNYDELTDDLFGVHTTGNSSSGKVTYQKKVSLVELKSKLKNNGFTEAEANYWTKELADQHILGEFSSASKALPDEELWKLHAKKTYDGKVTAPSSKYGPMVKAGQRDEAFEKAYQEFEDLKKTSDQLKANSKTPMQVQANASSDARALEKYLNDHFPDKMTEISQKANASVSTPTKADFEELYGQFKNASGQEKTNLQMQLENSYYKDFKAAQQQVKAAREAEQAAAAAKQSNQPAPTFEKAMEDYKNATGKERTQIQLWLEQNHYKEFKEAIRSRGN